MHGDMHGDVAFALDLLAGWRQSRCRHVPVWEYRTLWTLGGIRRVQATPICERCHLELPPSALPHPPRTAFQ